MEWTPVCAYAELEPERGVVALVGGAQVAVFRLYDGSLAAIGNHDPIARANVLARGIVGNRGAAPVVASPIYKQAFDLRSGAAWTSRASPYRSTRYASAKAWSR